MSEVSKELLDLDLNSIDTSFPVAKGGMYDLVVKESSVEPTSDTKGKMWVVKIGFVKDAMGVKGETIKAASHTLFHRVGLTETEKYEKDSIVKNVARVIQSFRPAVLGLKPADIFSPEFETKCKVFIGRMFQAKLEALPEGVDKKSGKTLPPRNEISQFVKAT